MSDADLVSCKSRLLDIFAQLDSRDLNSIEMWISSQTYKRDLEIKKKVIETEVMLIKIGDAIKELVPFNAEMSSEKIIPPTIGDLANCTETNMCHVDEFLYDQSEMEKLLDKEKIKRHYCLDCNSRNIKELVYISHSMSRQALQYIFKTLLPGDLINKQILDVGSRIGAVLYGAYYLTNAASIIGVEMNKELCEVQEKIIGKFSMDTNRIKIVHSDIMERPDLVENSYVVIINVLDFFVGIPKHKDMWYFFKKHLKKDSYLVCNRSIAETLDSLNINEEFMDWLTPSNPNQQEHEILFDIEDCSDIYLYTVN